MFFARRSIFTACLLVTGTATSVFAGGFGGSSAPVTQIPAPIPIPDYANTFYLRGDVGWMFHESPDISDPGLSYLNGDLGDSFSLGAGFGYNFRDNIRGDITLDYFSDADVTATNPDGATHRTDLSSIAVLANLYYDMRGRDRLTPYVGGGIGFSYNETGDHTTSAGATPGHGQAEFAAALMAGFSYRMDDRWMFDAGYRYLFLGDAKTKSAFTTNRMKIDDIRAHELRAGFRYEFQ